MTPSTPTLKPETGRAQTTKDNPVAEGLMELSGPIMVLGLSGKQTIKWEVAIHTKVKPETNLTTLPCIIITVEGKRYIVALCYLDKP